MSVCKKHDVIDGPVYATPAPCRACTEERITALEAAQTRHLELIRDLTQAPLPEDCLEAKNRVGVLTAKCATLRNERDSLAAERVLLTAGIEAIAKALGCHEGDPVAAAMAVVSERDALKASMKPSVKLGEGSVAPPYRFNQGGADFYRTADDIIITTGGVETFKLVSENNDGRIKLELENQALKAGKWVGPWVERVNRPAWDGYTWQRSHPHGTAALIYDDNRWRIMRRGVYVDYKKVLQAASQEEAKAAVDAVFLAEGYYLAKE